METKLHTLKELRKSWWWKRKEIRRDGVRGVDWPLVKEAARNYELMRRSTKGKQFTKTYPELDNESKKIIAILWVNWPQAPYRLYANPSQYNEVGWTPFYENQKIQWNLRLTNKKLTDAFIMQIKIWRKIQKIRKPRRNKGENHRGVSWKLVEVLDRKQNGVGKFTPSEHHTLTKARRKAKRCFREYKRALDEWNSHINPASIIEEDDDSDNTEQPE